ncbi:response regulator [Bowmanella dokdonensis]|uniref:Response regulator n=1 Tax=Bowmanella dokdonensis TaxID=751969 RepID=A0A939DTJ9_9ALTE|nr:response regulator [Bowmanella dokdonensis]MBN7827676.1 response regulator [Bowmanella dokdonensis]
MSLAKVDSQIMDKLMDPAKGNERKLILLVEDNDLVRRYTTTLLDLSGYDFVVAENAEQAIELLEQHPDIDLLLTDVMLPGKMDGLSLAEYAVRLRPGIKVILSSGDPGILDSVSPPLFSEEQFLHKPFTKDEFLTRLEWALLN